MTNEHRVLEAEHIAASAGPMAPTYHLLATAGIVLLVAAAIIFAFTDWPAFRLAMIGVFVASLLLAFTAFYIRLIHIPHRTARAERLYREAEATALLMVPYGSDTQVVINADYALEVYDHSEDRYNYKVDVAELQAQQLALPAPSIIMPSAPPYREIAHLVAPGRILLGCNTAGYIWGDITDLLSTAIVGRPGTGKSTMLRFVVAMVLRIGGTPVLWDPHGSIVDELGDVLTVAESSQEITASSRAIEIELEARLSARRLGQSVHQPMLLIADEWPIISQIAPDAIQIARRVVLEGRKVAMYALICGQGLPAQLLGGTLVRDALSSRYVFNTTAQQARMAGLDNETAKLFLAQLDTAGPGKAILASATRRPEIVAIPATTADDIRSLVPSASRNGQERLTDSLGAGVPIVPGERHSTLKSGLHVEERERERIIALATSGVPRREMCTRLGKGKHYYETVKAVLDEYEQHQEV